MKICEYKVIVGECMKYTFDVLEQIADIRNQLSAVEEKVATYVMANAKEVVSQSITELAENSGVSVATVSRFCRHLSLNGYQDFRVELVRSLAGSSDASVSRDISSEDSVPAMFEKMSALYANSFNKAIMGLDVAAFTRVCDMIDAAKDVHFVGTGNMLPIAMAAHLQFMEVSTKFHCVVDVSAQSLSTALMNEDSLVIAFAYSGQAISVVNVAQSAKKNKAKVVAITRYSQSPLVEQADETLICGVNYDEHMSSSLALCSGFQFIIDLLYTEYFRRNADTCASNKEKSFNVVVGRM